MADDRVPAGDPFAPTAAQSRLTGAAIAAIQPLLGRALGLHALRRLYYDVRVTEGRSFAGRILDALDIEVRTALVGDGAAIPATGPVIVAANHPTGALDGLVLYEVIRATRGDVRLLANSLLAAVPELHPMCFFVDPFGGPGAARRNTAGLRAALRWLRAGKALGAFPAGEVAWRGTAGGRVDSPWLPTIAGLAGATGAALVPAFIDGGNSPLFYAAGRLSPRLRTLLLGRELLNKRRRRVFVSIGGAQAVVSEDPASTTRSLRRAVDALRTVPPAGTTSAPIAPAVDPALLERDVASLGREALLLESGPLQVLCAEAPRLPHVLPEIGRLREATFREAGEGTGRPCDLDAFDPHYLHLFVWDREQRMIVGAYRAGDTQRIVARHGVEGLYTRTLFAFDRPLLERLGPALELGRSFVRAEYQRRYNPLLLLWRGIGRVAAHLPQCRALVGAVSISARYQERSRQLIRGFVERTAMDPVAARLVRPLHPPQPSASPSDHAGAPATVAQLEAAVREEEGVGMPVLLRQYLKMNARAAAFSVDPSFSNATDALMLLPLDTLPAAAARRYLSL